MGFHRFTALSLSLAAIASFARVQESIMMLALRECRRA